MDSNATPTGPRPSELWRSPGFLKFLLCRVGFVMSQQMLAVAVGWHVYAQTGNVLDLGLVGLSMFLPVMVLTLPAGVVADRYDRRVIVGSALLLHCLTAAAIGLWFSAESETVWPIFLLLAVSGSATAMLHPALQSTLPMLVKRDLLSFAIAGASLSTKGAQLVGPVIGGLLIAWGGSVVYVVCAALYLLGALAMASIRTELRRRNLEPFDLDAVLGGFRHIMRTPTVLGAMSIDLVAVLFGGLTGMLPVYAMDILEVGPEELGVMRAMPAIGALCVGGILAWRRLPWSVGRSFFGALAVFGLAILLFGISRNYWLTLLVLVLYGASDMMSVYIRQSLIQLGTPDELRGRVSAVNAVMVIGSTQLGDFRAGMMAAVIGAPAAVVLGGVVTLVASAVWFRGFPALSRMERF